MRVGPEKAPKVSATRGDALVSGGGQCSADDGEVCNTSKVRSRCWTRVEVEAVS